MYRTILIGCDVDQGSGDALALAQLLSGNGEEARLVAAGAGSGCDPRGLRVLAEEIRADLVVAGSSGNGTLGRVLPGDVAIAILHEATCAVAVAPRGFHKRESQSLRTIGVGYDGSPEARSALRVAAELARDHDAVFEVIGVVVPPGYQGPRVAYGYDEFVSMLELEVRERLEEAPALAGPDVSTKVRLLHGEPATALVAPSDELDLLVVGSRGHGLVGRVLLGSVSARVMRMAACPVLVVPRGVAVPPADAGQTEARRATTTDD